MRWLTIVKKIKKKLSTGIIFYLISSISVYFMCELLKASGVIKVNPYYFDNCVYAFKNECEFNLTDNKIYTVCGVLNYKENYTKFITNLIYMLLVIYTLLYNISFESFSFKYWIMVHVSTIGFSLLDYITISNFSFESNEKYNYIQILIIIIVSLILFVLIIRQAYRIKGLRYSFLISILTIYLFLFLLFKSVSSNVKLHFHHSFCSGFLSICFTDFSSILNLYLHAIMIGIVIQGINVYTINEIFLFNISYIPSPTFDYMVWVCLIYFTIWIMLILDISIIYNIYSGVKKKCCNKKENEIDLYKISLIPTEEELRINYG